MEKFVVNILRENILASLFVVLVLVVGIIVKKRYSSKWRYTMWLAVGIFLIVPISFFSVHAPIQIAIPQEIAFGTGESIATDAFGNSHNANAATNNPEVNAVDITENQADASGNNHNANAPTNHSEINAADAQ